MPNMDDVAAMRSQFQDMHQEAIQSRFQKQYMLRLSEVLKADDGADGDIEAETPGTFLDPDGTSAALKFNNFRPDGSDGEQKVDTQDVEEMKAEFGKYQKALLGTQIEKAFRLRADFDDEEDAAEQEQAHVTRMSQRDSEEMSATYRRLSKAQIDYSTLKQFETRVDAQIMPEHVCRCRFINVGIWSGLYHLTILTMYIQRERFDDLMQDIGIVNDSVMDRFTIHMHSLCLVQRFKCIKSHFHWISDCGPTSRTQCGSTRWSTKIALKR